MAPRTRQTPGVARHSPANSQHLDELIETIDRLTQEVDAHTQELARLRDEQQTQFKRFAQLQAEVDGLKQQKPALTRS